MQAHRDNMKQRVASAPSNHPKSQKTDVNQDHQGAKRKEQGGPKEKEAECDDESASHIAGDGGQDVPLPVKRTRQIAPGDDQIESESNSQEVFKGRQTMSESPEAALLRQMNAVEDSIGSWTSK